MISTWNGVASVNACGVCAGMTAALTDPAAAAAPPTPAPTAAPHAAPSPPPAMAPIAVPTSAPPTSFFVPEPDPPLTLSGSVLMDTTLPPTWMSVSVTVSEAVPFILLADSAALTMPYTFAPAGATSHPPDDRSWSRKPWKRLPALAVSELTSAASRTTRSVPDATVNDSATVRTGGASSADGPEVRATAGTEAGAASCTGGCGGRSTITYSSLPSAE